MPTYRDDNGPTRPRSALWLVVWFVLIVGTLTLLAWLVGVPW
jgi:hypothetical protein